MRKKALKDAVFSFKNTLKNRRDDLSKSILDKVVSSNLHKFQHKVSISLQDAFLPYFEELKKQIAEAVANRSPKWIVYNQNLQVFPKNCRFCYTANRDLILVIEEDPKPRTLNMIFSSKHYRYYLSLPYVYFIFHFKNLNKELSGNWKLQNVFTYWRNSSLTHIDDYMCRPVLPNTGHDMSICFGNVELHMSKSGSTVTQQVSDIISAYWTSQFNSDLSQFWNNKFKIDKRIETAENWVKFTKEDPNFILECNWTMADKLSTILNSKVDINDQAKSKFDTDIDLIVTSIVDRLGSRLDDFVIKEDDLNRFHPKEIVSKVGEVFNESFDSLLALIENLENAVDNIEEKPYKDIKVGNYWR